MHEYPVGGDTVELWQCSSCSSPHKGADTGPAAGLMIFYSPVQLFLSNTLSPGILPTLLQLGETADLVGEAERSTQDCRSLAKKNKTRAKSVRKDQKRAMVCVQNQQKHSLHGRVHLVSLSFTPKEVK